MCVWRPRKARTWRGLAITAAFALLALAPACLNWESLQNGRCGDGFLGREERCDDGNLSAGDGCDEHCKPEPPRSDAGPEPKPSQCGNGDLESGEGCDDRNKVAGDGCSEICQREPAGPLCGNGALDPEEACDDRNTSNADSCLNGCSLATCGDGQVRKNVEECDPASPDHGDMCTPPCLLCAGPGSHYRLKHCFTLHAETATAADARAVCQAEGGDLWTVTTAEEGSEASTKLSLSGPYWLGLLTSDTGSSWVTGEDFEFANFAAGEPQPASRCVALVAAGSADLWQSNACETKLSFVCERVAASVLLPSNHAYKVNTAAVTLAEARERCARDGAALVALESAEERNFVAARIDGSVWVDATEQSEGTFVWPNGAAVDVAAFQQGQPDDTDGTQGCLILGPARRFADTRCDQLRAFVCEHD